ncbi:MAG TPA: hypothetical protein VKR58_09330 [Aquella sp.]|nr:hypothetical protein [Aquella sp.]
MSYLRSFVIGSSFFVFIWFFLVVRNISSSIKNYTYDDYTLVAPIYLGMMNVLSLYIAHQFDLSLRMRYVVIGIISPLIVIIFARWMKTYNFTNAEWNKYSLMLIMQHFLIFNLIVYYLEKNI